MYTIKSFSLAVCLFFVFSISSYAGGGACACIANVIGTVYNSSSYFVNAGTTVRWRALLSVGVEGYHGWVHEYAYAEVIFSGLINARFSDIADSDHEIRTTYYPQTGSYSTYAYSNYYIDLGCKAVNRTDGGGAAEAIAYVKW